MKSYSVTLKVGTIFFLLWAFEIVSVWGAMFFTASHFDETEVNALFLYGAFAFGIHSIAYQHLIKSVKATHDRQASIPRGTR